MILNIIKAINKQINPLLVKNLSIKNVEKLPKISKINISTGLGQELKNEEFISSQIAYDLMLISGQLVASTKAKKSISNFNIQKFDKIGYKVTLRKNNLYVFLTKFILITCPHIRNFQGFSINSFDKGGNFSLGLLNQFSFPEIVLKDNNVKFGMTLNLHFKNSNIKTSLYIMRLLNFILV